MSDPAFLLPQEAGNPLPLNPPGIHVGDGVGRTCGTIATYQWGCRCVDCRAAKRLYTRKNVSQRVAHRADMKAAKWLRANMPDIWHQLREEAKEEITASDGDET